MKSSENNMDKSEKIIWKNRGERKDVKEGNNMHFFHNNNTANNAIMTLYGY